MRLFEINETYIAANTKVEALIFLGLSFKEVESIEEIPDSEWDEEIEYYDLLDEDRLKHITFRELMQPAIQSGETTVIFN